MRSDIVPGGTFPDYELPDHEDVPRRLSEIQGDDPLILTLARGHYCPKEHQQHLELAANYPKINVAYTRVATIATDEHHTLQEFRNSVGAQWPFLADPGRIVQKDLDIQEYTDPDNDPMIPHTLVLKPGLIVHTIYNGYWFWGRPSFVDLWHDLRDGQPRDPPRLGPQPPQACEKPGRRETCRPSTAGTSARRPRRAPPDAVHPRAVLRPGPGAHRGPPAGATHGVSFFDGLTIRGDRRARRVVRRRARGAPAGARAYPGRVGVRAVRVLHDRLDARLRRQRGGRRFRPHAVPGVEEFVLHVDSEGGRIELPMALAADLDAHARMTELRIYFSRWPLSGVRGARPPLLQPDPLTEIYDDVHPPVSRHLPERPRREIGDAPCMSR